MNLLYLLGFLCLVAAGSHKKRINEEEYYKRNKHKKNRIAGGTEAHIQEMPYMAAFIIKGPSYHSGLDQLICTAVIVHPFWVLMGASKLENIDAAYPDFLKNSSYVIRSNTAWFDGSTDMYQDHAIEEFHTKLCPTDANITRRLRPMVPNLGLIKVKTEFKRAYEKPINIVPRDYEYEVGSRASQAGWGATETSHNYASPKLMETNTRLTDFEKCRRFYRYFPKEEHYVFNGLVCTFAHGKRPCLGDAGGPLIQNGILIGILGYDKHCAIPDWPDVYTKLTSCLSWIEDTISNVTKVRKPHYRTGKIIY